MTEHKGQRREEIEDLVDPGDWAFRGETIWIQLPATFGGALNLPVIVRIPVSESGQTDREWSFDGNRDAPTLKPSIRSTGSWGTWHGWMTGGVLSGNME